MRTIEAKGKEVIHLGSEGENNVLSITFDISKWIEELGDGGEITLLYKRPDDDGAYPVDATLSDGIVTWVVSDTDTEQTGTGKCQLEYVIDDTVEKSAIYNTRVSASLELVGSTTVLADDDGVVLSVA